MPTLAETNTAAAMAAGEVSTGQRRTIQHQERAAVAQQDAHGAADQAQHDGLHQELPQDVAGPAPTAMRRPISRVRSVTDTSMMFMIPTPPTTSEIMATHSSRLVIRVVVEDRVLVISVMSRMVKSSGLALDGCGAARAAGLSSAGWRRESHRRAPGGGQDLVDVGETDGHRVVCGLDFRLFGVEAGLAAGIEVAQGVHRTAGTAAAAALVGVLPASSP